MTLTEFLQLLLAPALLFASEVRGDDPPIFHAHGAGCQSGCWGRDGCAIGGLCNHGDCGKVCRATVAPVTEEESCWVVECEKICVPRVVCPWSEGGSGLTLFNCLKHKSSSHCADACPCCGEYNGGCGCRRLAPRCGDVRCVRVLNSHDYEITRYKCNWDLNSSTDSCNCRSCVDANAPPSNLNQVKQAALELPTQPDADTANEPESAKRPFWKFW